MVSLSGSDLESVVKNVCQVSIHICSGHVNPLAHSVFSPFLVFHIINIMSVSMCVRLNFYVSTLFSLSICVCVCVCVCVCGQLRFRGVVVY